MLGVYFSGAGNSKYCVERFLQEYDPDAWALFASGRTFEGNICESDWHDFMHVEKVSHNKYVAEHSDFFGEWNEQILLEGFGAKRKMTFFKKFS